MTEKTSPNFAAIDLGSNSFHMIIARQNAGTIEVIDRVKEMVQIAKGFDKEGLTDEAQERALQCLTRFAERTRCFLPSHVKAVGTKTLRSAKNSRKFLKAAEAALNQPIEIISGQEEARLVYRGLAYSVTNDGNTRLVVDIGGGSTEFIIGKDAAPELLESLALGCVTFTEKYKLDKAVNKSHMTRAYMGACNQLETIQNAYLRRGWDLAYGTSGTIKAIAELTGHDGAAITRDSLTALWDKILSSPEDTMAGLPKQRKDVLPAGIAILRAIFDTLRLDVLHAANATLKDGLLVETIYRFTDPNRDPRLAAVAKLQKRHNVDKPQADRVSKLAIHFWRNLDSTVIPGISRTKILKWAAELHEVGLGISHSGYHNHGYYILKHSDLEGFGRYEQHLLACLVAGHRKKLKDQMFEAFEGPIRDATIPLLVCLRLAVLLCRSRQDLSTLPTLSYDKFFTITLNDDWLKQKPLTEASLNDEQNTLAKAGITLKIVTE